MHHLIALVIIFATKLVRSQTSVVSLFLGDSVLGVPTAATGYVASADATATTYVINCIFALCDGTPHPEYARVTVAPSSMELNGGRDGTTTHRTCTITGSTEATCVESTMTRVATATEAEYDTMTYVPTPPAHRGQENIFQFPGYLPVLITSGAMRLDGATALTPTFSGTMTASGPRTTRTPSTTAKANAAAVAGGGDKAGYGVIALAAVALGF